MCRGCRSFRRLIDVIWGEEHLSVGMSLLWGLKRIGLLVCLFNNCSKGSRVD
jgi:hypothetical protein